LSIDEIGALAAEGWAGKTLRIVADTNLLGRQATRLLA
jgi:hypothetical protein